MGFGKVWIRKPHHPLFDGWSHSCEVSKADTHSGQTQRVLGTVVGDTSSKHNTNSYYRNPTFYHMGTLPFGKSMPDEPHHEWLHSDASLKLLYSYAEGHPKPETTLFS